VLAVILVVAAALRLTDLGAGLWYDEVVTLVEFVRLTTIDLLTTYTTPNNHILFTLAAKGSVAAIGETAAALRLPAVLCGIASIAAIWLLGRHVTAPGEATLAAAMAAVSYHHVWFSQNARGYTGLLLCVLLATWLFIRGLQRPERASWVAYGAVIAAALYIHLSAAFTFAAHGLVYLVMYTRRRLAPPTTDDRHPGAATLRPLAGIAFAAALAAAVYAPLLPQLLETFSAQRSDAVKVTEWTNPLWTAAELIRGLGGGPLSWGAALIGGVIAAVGLASYMRRDVVLTTLMLLPVPVTLAALIATSFHVWPRYFFVAAGFALLIFARGLMVTARAIGQRLRAPRAAPAVAAIGALAALAMMLPKNYALPKQDYAGARDWVMTSSGPGDAVLTVGMASYCYQNLFAPGWTPIDSLEDLDVARQGHDRVWLVYSFPTVLQTSHPQLYERLDAEFERVAEFPGTLADGTIFVCRSR